MIPRTLVLILGAFLVHACGGGGGSSPVTMIPPMTAPPEPVAPDHPAPPPVTEIPPPPVSPDPPPGQDPAPDPGPSLLPFPYVHTADTDIPPYNLSPAPSHRLADIPRIPVYADSERLLIGVDQTATHIADLPVVGQRRHTAIRHGALPDGAPSNDLVRYLREALPQGASRFDEPPTVRFIGNVSDQKQINRALEAIRFVNAALPENFKIRVPSTTPVPRPPHFGPPPSAYHFDGTAEEHTIYIDFVDSLSTGGYAWRWALPGRPIDHAYIALRNNHPHGNDNHLYLIGLVAHELLHTLGFRHTPHGLVSIMDATGRHHHLPQQPLSTLHPLDREALRILYTRLENGDGPASFGPWESTSVHIAGNGPHANFGVALRNGYAEPWAYGRKPATELSGNPALSGSATWTGTLVGLTPAASSVIGDASIAVDLASMTGNADFTSLETWTAGTAPGAPGTGARWLDGDLGYSISVHGNTFQETGGDPGSLTGVFTGPSHEGVAGTLERSDLTAAFGGSRQ